MQCKQCGAPCKIQAGRHVCIYCGWESDEAVQPAPAPVESGAREYGSEVYDKCIGGVLELYYSSMFTGWSGSGYIITDDGYAITNAHVVTDASNNKFRIVKELEAHVSGKKLRAAVLAVGDDKAGSGSGVDLALIKLNDMPEGVHKVNFGDFDKLRNGERVYIIGNSRGQGSCITAGIVSDLVRSVGGKPHMMTDCAMNPGNSGGPIFNKDGEVIGTVDCYRPDSKGMNYTIPLPLVTAFIQACEKSLKVKILK